jgi:hypothetical protein
VREKPEEPKGRPADRAGVGVRRRCAGAAWGVRRRRAVAADCSVREWGVWVRCGGEQRWTIGLGCVCEAYLGRAVWGSSKRPKIWTGKRKNRPSPRNAIFVFLVFFGRQKKTLEYCSRPCKRTPFLLCVNKKVNGNSAPFFLVKADHGVQMQSLDGVHGFRTWIWN